MLAICPVTRQVEGNKMQTIQAQVSKCAVNPTEQTAFDGTTVLHPPAPDGHEYIRIKAKAKDSPVAYWIVPLMQAQCSIIADEKDQQIVEMLADLFNQQRKLWIKELEDGNSLAGEWLLDVTAAAKRYFVNGRTLGVKQSEIEEWIKTVLGSYMTARIAKNGGFSEEAKVNLVKALVEKFLTASTRDNETKVGKDIVMVNKADLADLQKRLETYNMDENNKLESGEEFTALLNRIKNHQNKVVKDLADTSGQF